MSKEFKRQDYMRHLKLGKKKRKISWRQPKGRHSKMRQGMRGYPKTVSIGYKTKKSQLGKISNLTPILIHNIKEANNFPKNSIAIIARIGAKKKLEVIKILNEKKIKILNVFVSRSEEHHSRREPDEDARSKSESKRIEK